MILDTAKYLGPCACGREHSLRTRLVVCESGALQRFDRYLADAGLAGWRVAIYDTNTYALARVPADQEIVLDAAGLHSEKGLIEACMARFERRPDVIVAVGGGTLMDFGRYSAYQLGTGFAAVPTIVSSDGFTANICSIIIDGQKKSIPMIAPDAVICDMDVIAGAPAFLTVAGVQDILAKYISLADWKIAHLAAGEYFCPRVCAMAEEALTRMRACAEGLRRGEPADLETMAYAQMLSGLTMQILSHSRAASGAEHLVAHLVEMKPRGFEQAHGLHGECVGVGTILCAEAYHALCRRETVTVRPFRPLDEAWVRWEFGALADGILQENENDVLASFPPENIAAHWAEIRQIVAEIPTAEELTALYAAIGAKHSLEELGIDPAVKADFLAISSAIRNRLTLARMTRLIAD